MVIQNYSDIAQFITPIELNKMAYESIEVSGLCKCPICGDRFTISIPKIIFEKFKSDEGKCLLSHIHLHGNPCHGLELQLDKNLKVRHSYAVNSIQINQNYENLAGIMKLWTKRF